MRTPLQLVIIFGICLVGEFLHHIVGIPLPGNIIGMVILFVLLCLKILKPEQISGVSGFFLNHLALFFLPPSIAIMAIGEDVLRQWPLLLCFCILVSLITLSVTGFFTQLFVRKQEYRDNIALRIKRTENYKKKENL